MSKFLNKIINADCLKEIKKIPDKSFDLIFADPPYNMQINDKLLRPDSTKVDGVNDKWNIISKKSNIILVEPHKESAQRLKSKGLNVIESVLNSEDNKEVKFYSTKKATCSSFYKPNFNHLGKFSNSDRFKIISEEIFVSQSIDTEIKKFPQPDFIKIDTEGSEWYVIKHMSSRPDVISIETHGGYYVNPYIREIKKWMDDYNYKLWFKDNSDSVYVKKDVIKINYDELLFLLLKNVHLSIRRSVKGLKLFFRNT